MAFTQTQIDDLKAAIAEGTLRVRIDGKEIIYRSLAEMRQTLAMMERELGHEAGGAPRTRQLRFQTAKGL